MISKGENSISSREEIKSLEISYLELSKIWDLLVCPCFKRKERKEKDVIYYRLIIFTYNDVILYICIYIDRSLTRKINKQKKMLKNNTHAQWPTFRATSSRASSSKAFMPIILDNTISWSCRKVYGWSKTRLYGLEAKRKSRCRSRMSRRCPCGSVNI